MWLSQEHASCGRSQGGAVEVTGHRTILEFAYAFAIRYMHLEIFDGHAKWGVILRMSKDGVSNTRH